MVNLREKKEHPTFPKVLYNNNSEIRKCKGYESKYLPCKTKQ